MNLVFVSYPYHYHITMVSIKRINDLYGSKIKSITVVFDNFDEYINSKIHFVTSLKSDLASIGIDANIVPFSLLKETKLFSKGWERQQIVKLNLHKILDYNEWVCIDGDTLFQEKIKLTKLYVNIKDAIGPWTHHYNFVNYVLDLNYEKIQYKDLILNSVSGIPFRHVKKEMLRNLHSYIKELHGCDIVEILHSFTLKKNITRYLEISEWDLMGHFEILICKNNLPIEDLSFVTTETEQFERTVCNNKIKVLAGIDKLSQKWFEQQGIHVNQNIFKLLGYNL